jgi:GxxExxY protein
MEVNALAIELRKLGLEVISEARIIIYYDDKVVGEYFADLLVAGAVIVELKAVRKLLEEHEAQLLNYLKATPYEVGLLLNFGPKPEIKRKAFDNSRKGSMLWLEKSPA